MHFDFSAISDVGRVRKDNQDSGYVGNWFVAVCDGVGGAVRGDIASSTAIQQLRKLDTRPPEGVTPDEMLSLVAGALQRAHSSISDLVDEDPALNGTSTTATVGLFDGQRLAVGHVGDSRAYLFRTGELSRITRDHTFVQSLIDEGRITEEESRVHPHRNLILKAIDGSSDLDPDLFVLELQVGDRLLFCSDGPTASLDDGRLADVLSSGTPDYAAVELVRTSLEAGTTDNVTCLVVDVLDGDLEGTGAEPLLVGAASELRRRAPRGAKTGSLFRGHRSGDTGELEPISAEVLDEVPFAIASDPLDHVDPETARYAPRPPSRFTWARRVLAIAAIVGVLWVIAAAAWSWSQDQYYVGEQDGSVVIYRGLNTSLPGIDLSSPYETTNVELDRLSDFDAGKVREGIDAGSLSDARSAVDNLAAKMSPVTDSDDAGTAP